MVVGGLTRQVRDEAPTSWSVLLVRALSFETFVGNQAWRGDSLVGRGGVAHRVLAAVSATSER